ncbi:hypothetical protein [Segatella copri]|uniref:Uncharacterized protein n=1 Tax=Segatella copri TaxID=165179 RepID=A0AA90URX9_9BACT|nr:hypothetical protein [Segatella copri]MQN78322.1 hypothetical protein [Segatella copri]MQO00468.1 hypothetical protein [Segatella copri]
MTNQTNQIDKMDKTELKKIAETCVSIVKNGGVLEQAQLEADEKIAELAANGDLDAIKLLNERMQDREELKLRKKLFGV